MATQSKTSFEQSRLILDSSRYLSVQRVARLLVRRFDAALRPFDLTSGQFMLLNALNRSNPPNMGEVAQLIAIDRTTLTAALKPLIRRKLIALTANPADRRSRLLRLTPRGRELLAEAIPIWQHTDAKIESELSEQGISRLQESMKAPF